MKNIAWRSQLSITISIDFLFRKLGSLVLDDNTVILKKMQNTIKWLKDKDEFSFVL